MLSIRNACSREVSEERSFYKTGKKDLTIKPLKVLDVNPSP